MLVWFKKYSSILRASIITALEYKANSVVGLFAILSGLLIEYLIWSMIYSSQSSAYTIDGWTFNRLIAYIFLSMIIGQLKSSWVTAHEMIMQIRQGFMNQYLVKPLSFFSYHLMNFIGTNILYYIPYAILIFIAPIIFKDLIFINFVQVPFFILAVIISIYLSYSIYFFMVCFAFWFGEVRAMIVSYNLFNVFLSGQLIPIALFPEGLKQFVMHSPFRFMVDFPVSIATGILPEEQRIPGLISAIMWSILLSIIASMIYKMGIKDYEAYGS